MSLYELSAMNGLPCDCGKTHTLPFQQVLTGNGIIQRLPQVLEYYHAQKPFLLSDKNTYQAAGKTICELLDNEHISYHNYVIEEESIEPDEKSVGSVIMHYEYSCDLIIAIGSGVINDIGKILSAVAKLPYIIVATAPSMDGYASATSSMTRDGLKISLPSKSADVIIGDTDILKNAPLHMLKSGIGDMLAKYVSICEWRISHVITGEYYCEKVATLVRLALKRCVDNAEKLLQRDETAIEAVFEGLVICGAAMSYAGLSRPASGVEHYLSHIWDMRGVEFGTKVDLHGIQCAVGTLIALKGYEKIRNIVPEREKALLHAQTFDYHEWSLRLCEFLGKGAKSMIDTEQKEGKYNIEKHAKRLETILKRWDDILQIIEEELPSCAKLEQLLDLLQMPKTTTEIGIDETIVEMSFMATKDIRDKYVLSRLAWDLGIL